LRRPVVDQTGLKGTFDFQFDIANDQPVDDVVPSIVTSMREESPDAESWIVRQRAPYFDHRQPSETKRRLGQGRRILYCYMSWRAITVEMGR